jgi:protein CpxP
MKQKRGNIVRIATTLCTAAMLMTFSTVALAQGEGWGRHHGNRHHHHCFMKFEKRLGLTEAQKAQAKAIFQANREVVKPLIEGLRMERKNLHALMSADKIDEAAIHAETAKLAEIQADLNVNRAKVGAQFRALLTPEQLVKMKEFKGKGRHHRGNDIPLPPPTE